MAEGFEYVLDYQQIYGLNYRGLEPNWDFYDEYMATNPITNVELFPRCSTPIPKELKPRFLRALPFSTCLFDDQCYEEFKNGLKRLPESVSVHGVKYPPQFMINGNLMSHESIKVFKEPVLNDFMQNNYHQLGANVESKHPKCQKKFNDNQQLSPKLRTSEPYLLSCDENELNTLDPNLPPFPAIPIHEEYSSLLNLSNDLDLINDKNTLPCKEEVFTTMKYADSKQSDDTERLKTNEWSPESNALKSVPISMSGGSDTELPSTSDDFDLSDLLNRLRAVLKDD